MPTYVQHEVLDRIPDVFNAEAIWQAPGFALFSRRPLLRDLLERSPRELRGRAATRCFSHIQLRLPQEDMDDDYHLTRGARARELADTLATLHQKDFGDLLGGDQVRYDVAADEHLSPGEIVVRFGHAVYLPARGEKALFNIATSRDGAVWKPACAIYPGQRLSLIGGPGGIQAPGWPFGDQGGVLLVNDGPESEPVVQVRPKEALDCVFDAGLGAYAISAKGGNGPRLLLKISRASGGAAQGRPAVWMPRGLEAGDGMAASGAVGAVAPSAPTAPTAGPLSAGVMPKAMAAGLAHGSAASGAMTAVGGRAAALDDATAVPQAPRGAAPLARRAGESDATFAPGAVQRLTLVALAIPRLSMYRSTGASALHIPFAPDLAIGRSADADRVLTVVANADDTLHALSEAGRQPLELPVTLAANGRPIRMLPAPENMAERYLALLQLPQSIAMPLLPGGKVDFGRSLPALSALRVLDQPWMLESATPSSPDRLGLSRQAFSCEASGRTLSVSRLTDSQALYLLDERMQAIDMPGAPACQLQPGQHLVAGSYVLRYDA